MPFLQTDMGFGPDYGPWTFQLLHEPFLTKELARLAGAKSIGGTDCVTLQPCPDPDHKSQDRYVVLEWPLAGGLWKFAGVFDGHAGEETADYIIEALPPSIEHSLSSALSDLDGNGLSSATVSDILTKAISDFDNSIRQDLLDMFPGGADAVAKLSDDKVSCIINDSEAGGQNSAKVMRCMRGSTAIVSLMDPSEANLWVASLGDCQAVLGVRSPSGEWTSSLLSSNHNGRDKREAARVRDEHPGEDECIIQERVLGSIAVTRAIGDHLFKLPRIYTDRVFLNSKPGFRMTANVDDIIQRNLTPPYLSNQADVQHVDLTRSKGLDRVLIMCSDGLMDLYDHDGALQLMAQRWVEILGNGELKSGYENMALRLLRDALGGTDEKVSRMLTVEMPDRWMDDTTVLVRKL